ncbi:hypothetical protein SCATT_p16230 (plasmid) [Streptantibioticus cattleyicolor NRRL 8057 = DSM 46488]|uniref:Uncharacterized protein n=1 Tax=Streptantibioticus cattleyicolor (strain ATCC 35852 / DSM 46488 / JCM 4925 / NBRC 14057 / NRRL 8057) TaxID=1003195 RepID=G8XHH9_STREN|nr:hypothetical protein SCATT_p16230 [Streptantibioticus cattleyicolor NRRL 8057 = DSM 46488]
MVGMAITPRAVADRPRQRHVHADPGYERGAGGPACRHRVPPCASARRTADTMVREGSFVVAQA